MSSEIAGTVQSIRLLWDIVQANKTLTDYNKLVAAVSEVNADLMGAQAVALDAQKEQMALAQRIRELEEKIVKLEDWNREAERYQLTEIAPGVPAYSLKPGMEQGEPAHHLCANCFARKEKMFLQYGPMGTGITARCTRCSSTFFRR